MANDIPSRPQTIEDLMIGLMQDQDDSGDLPDTQLYDAQALSEIVAVSDAVTLLTHGATYKYDVGRDYDALLVLEPGLIHWWKCHEASGNLADSGSSPAALTDQGFNTYHQTGPFPLFPAETAIKQGGGYVSGFGLPALPSAFSIEMWSNGALSFFSISGNPFFALNGASDLGGALGDLTAGLPTYALMLWDTPTASFYSTPFVSGLASPSWNYTVFTFDGAKTMQVWVNNVLATTYTAPVTVNPGSITHYAIQPGSPGPTIAEVAIYNYVLSPTTIASHYIAGVPDARYGLAVYA